MLVDCCRDVVQWGYNSVLNTPTALTFPVSFTSRVYALTIGNVGEAVYNGNTCVYDITSNGCTIAFNARAYWVAIGIQQWGLGPITSDGRTTELPISFSNSDYCLYASVYYVKGYDFWRVPINATKTGPSEIYMGAYDATKPNLKAFFFAIGHQRSGDVTLKVIVKLFSQLASAISHIVLPTL